MVLLSLTRPSKETVDRTCLQAQRRGFCYPHPGESKDFPPIPPSATKHGYAIDHNRVQLGYGKEVYEKAKDALTSWKHFQLGWAEVDSTTEVKKGSPVCVKAKVFFFWTRQPLQIVYVEDQKKKGLSKKIGIETAGGEKCTARFTFGHGCLHSHMLAGEERFAVEMLEEDNSVWYDVAAFSKPAGPLSSVFYPFVRLFQRRFAHCSQKAMKTAMESPTN
mmetsp:Transcript_9678/g.13144  ORF Transcript_9678/g.13144 Transcript_9678/m.13144 type:complete len:219 (-) Transcript_9678:98-754(-)|eukprot:CAMPEP_0196571284 /NCGR_PEP_ID=MMETSP1081-20130531/1466_1 /TAXON_ID=36882 /ORGANISM="Pyramimonas amylifera, Strain CCMP720" /LENGTH=218 /DNA_ID=CAMNT_0041888161 /DNA_START=137 /DNA_END=793 /DNA_ORIENTATION=+